MYTFRSATHNDIAAQFSVSTVLDVNSSSYGDEITTIYQGLVSAALDAGVIILGGETAELGACVGGEWEDGLRFLLSGSIHGVYHPTLMITGETANVGDVVIALAEDGFRANGISSVRSAFQRVYGDRWWQNSEAMAELQAAATPSLSYSRLLTKLNGWHDGGEPLVRVKHIAHISGEGIVGKFGHDFLQPFGLSATLDNLFEPPEIMLKCAAWREFPADEVYTTWNGGQGALLTVRPGDVAQILELCTEFDTRAQVAGNITTEAAPMLRIASKFSNEELTYPMST